MLLAAMLAVAAQARAESTAADAPDFVLKSLSGENLRLSEYRGEVVVLGFWASWCGDCRSHLDALAALQARYRDAGLRLLTVSLDSDRRRAADAAVSIDAAYPVLLDPGGETGRLYDVSSLPQIVLIDRDGAVRGVFAEFGRGDDEPYLAPIVELIEEW